MLIFHTADWHLGAQLANRRRAPEHQAFLRWLLQQIANHQANALIIAGDVFDTTTPPTYAQETYFHFLSQLADLPHFRHAIIVAGNHDSPSFLDAPAPMLSHLNIHVIGSAKANPADEVIVLKNEFGEDELIVCAVPYLRERDVRTSQAGESQSDKNQKVIQGTAKHYAETFQAACAIRGERQIPIIGTGHLFCTSTKNSHIEQGDGVRELYVGTLNRFPVELFPAFDYLALGHLHIPQNIHSNQLIRYSGSPIQMGFGECTQQKSITTIQFERTTPKLDTLSIPVFQRLAKLSGCLKEIQQQIADLPDECVWLEIHYTGAEHIADLRTTLESCLKNTPHNILKIRNHHQREYMLSQQNETESLENLDIYQVFERCLDANHIPLEQRPELQHRYHDAVKTYQESEFHQS